MLSAALFGFAGFTGLCLSMDKHHQEVLGRKPDARRRLCLKTLGWLALAACTGTAVHQAGWARGLVEALAVCMGAAVLLVFLMPYKPAWIWRLGLICAAGGSLLRLAGL